MITRQLTASVLAEQLSQFIDPHNISDHSINGLQITNNGIITQAATGVSADLETIKQAVALKAQALIVHHGLFWKGDSYVLDGTRYEKVKLLMHRNIALLAYHLPLDAHETLGNNWKAARDLGWNNLQPFCECDGTLIGVRGTFPHIPFDKLKQQLADYYRHPITAVSDKKEISSAALVSGNAYKFINQAVEAQVDCFVTGSFDLPVWHTAHEEHIAFCACGHAATEKVGPRALAAYIHETCDIRCDFIDTENPF